MPVVSKWLLVDGASLSGSRAVACGHLSAQLRPAALRAQAVSFRVTLLAASEGALKTKAGVTNGLAADHANGAGTPLITAVSPGGAMSNVALFIDANRASLKATAATEHWWWFCGPWCGPPGWGGPGWGWG